MRALARLVCVRPLLLLLPLLLPCCCSVSSARSIPSHALRRRCEKETGRGRDETAPPKRCFRPQPLAACANAAPLSTACPAVVIIAVRLVLLVCGGDVQHRHHFFFYFSPLFRNPQTCALGP